MAAIQELVRLHAGKISKAKDEQSTASSTTQERHKAAKAAGLNLDALKLAIRIDKMDTLAGQALLAALPEYLAAMNSSAVTQDALFGDGPTAVEPPIPGEPGVVPFPQPVKPKKIAAPRGKAGRGRPAGSKNKSATAAH